MSLPIAMKGFDKIFSEDEIKSLKKVMTNHLGRNEKTTWDDNVFLPGFSAKFAKDSYESLQLKEDVLLVSHPKTGTLWTLEILQRIIYQDEKEYELASNVPHQLLFIDIAPRSAFEIMDKIPLKRRIAASHLQANLVNVEKYTKANTKVVYVLRNPKDQMVSQYHFMKALSQFNITSIVSIHTSWDEYFDQWMQGDFPVSMKYGESYLDHILTWYKHKNKKNVYFIYYEDLIKDLEGQIKHLSKFLDTPISNEKVKRIAEASRFNNMKKLRATDKDFVSQLMAKNMRKGGVGGWKDHLTVRQSEKIDAVVKEKFKDTDIKFTYEL